MLYNKNTIKDIYKYLYFHTTAYIIYIYIYCITNIDVYSILYII